MAVKIFQSEYYGFKKEDIGWHFFIKIKQAKTCIPRVQTFCFRVHDARNMRNAIHLVGILVFLRYWFSISANFLGSVHTSLRSGKSQGLPWHQSFIPCYKEQVCPFHFVPLWPLKKAHSVPGSLFFPAKHYHMNRGFTGKVFCWHSHASKVMRPGRNKQMLGFFRRVVLSPVLFNVLLSTIPAHPNVQTCSLFSFCFLFFREKIFFREETGRRQCFQIMAR